MKQFIINQQNPFHFWNTNGEFKVEDNIFNCLEHYVNYGKAKYFATGKHRDENLKIAQKILSEDKPFSQRNLAKTVKNFDNEKWKRVCEWIMYDAIIYKAKSVEKFKNNLIECKDDEFIFLSTTDKIWGYIVPNLQENSTEDLENLNLKDLQGMNLMGKVLSDAVKVVEEHAVEEAEMYKYFYKF